MTWKKTSFPGIWKVDPSLSCFLVIKHHFGILFQWKVFVCDYHWVNSQIRRGNLVLVYVILQLDVIKCHNLIGVTCFCLSSGYSTSFPFFFLGGGVW